MSFFSKSKERLPPDAEASPAPAPAAAPAADPARDALTGLLSNDALVDECRKAVEAATGGESVGIVYFSFDGLRELNDRAGNLVTDKLLRELGRRLRDVVREGDHVGRISRDEFIVILRGLGNRLATLTLVARLRNALAEPISSGKDAYVPIVDYGMAHPPADGTTLEALSAAAERSMLAMREQNRVAMREKAQQRVVETRAAVNAAMAHISECEAAVRDADAALIESKRLLADAKAAAAAAIDHAKTLGVAVDAPPGGTR
jgi:diguanylate cyclase (GGDEF)-like protein